MGFLHSMADHLGSLSAGDIPGGRSIFGDFEAFIPMFTPLAEGRDPTEEDLIDMMGAAPYMPWSPGPAKETLQEGKRNIDDYVDRRRDIMDRDYRGDIQQE